MEDFNACEFFNSDWTEYLRLIGKSIEETNWGCQSPYTGVVTGTGCHTGDADKG